MNLYKKTIKNSTMKFKTYNCIASSKKNAFKILKEKAPDLVAINFYYINKNLEDKLPNDIKRTILFTKIAYENENKRELTSTERKHYNYMKALLDDDFNRFIRAKVYCFKGAHGYKFII